MEASILASSERFVRSGRVSDCSYGPNSRDGTHQRISPLRERSFLLARGNCGAKCSGLSHHAELISESLPLDYLPHRLGNLLGDGFSNLCHRTKPISEIYLLTTPHIALII